MIRRALGVFTAISGLQVVSESAGALKPTLV